MCEKCSKWTIKTSEGRHVIDIYSGDLIVNFEYISHIVLVIILLTLNK